MMCPIFYKLIWFRKWLDIFKSGKNGELFEICLLTQLSVQHLFDSLCWHYWPFGRIWVSCCFSSWIAGFPLIPTERGSGHDIWLWTSTSGIQIFRDCISLWYQEAFLRGMWGPQFRSGPEFKLQRHGAQLFSCFTCN